MEEMKKDGTKYLAHVLFENGTQDWLVIHWSDRFWSDRPQVAGWVSNHLKLKVKEIIEFHDLDDALVILR